LIIVLGAWALGSIFEAIAEVLLQAGSVTPHEVRDWCETPTRQLWRPECRDAVRQAILQLPDYDTNTLGQEAEWEYRRAKERMVAANSADGYSPNAVQEDYPHQFERDGEVWRLRFRGERGAFGDTKGLRCIARLLEKPNRGIEALNLEGIDAKSVPRQQADDDVLTEEAKAEFKERLGEIRGEKETAVNSGNDAEYERLEKEGDGILKQLKAMTGTNGRSRKLQAGNAAVAAHDRVEKAIKAAREKIAEAGLRELADHLENTIKAEGVSFAYRPGSPASEWKVSY
jgi:hypothetical protein